MTKRAAGHSEPIFEGKRDRASAFDRFWGNRGLDVLETASLAVFGKPRAKSEVVRVAKRLNRAIFAPFYIAAEDAIR